MQWLFLTANAQALTALRAVAAAGSLLEKAVPCRPARAQGP